MKKSTEWLGPLLLIGVFARHDLTWLPGYSPSAWFYMLGGMWEILLCSTILLTVTQTPLLSAALWIGILEGAQVSTCRLLISDISKVQGKPLCDYVTGLPIGATMTGVYLLLIVFLTAREWKRL